MFLSGGKAKRVKIIETFRIYSHRAADRTGHHCDGDRHRHTVGNADPGPIQISRRSSGSPVGTGAYTLRGDENRQSPCLSLPLRNRRVSDLPPAALVGNGSAASGGSVRLLPESTLFMGGAAIESESFLLPSRNGDRPHDGEPVGSLTSPAVQEENAKPLAPNQSSPVPTPSTSLVPTVSGWSKPILFFPNGRTSTAVIFLRSRPEPDKQDYYSEISYRGITGSARVSSISVYPPGSPEFPSVLSPQAFSRLNAEAPSSSAERNLFR